MKNFEVQHTIRLYDPELIATIGRTYDAHSKEFRNKNEFLTELLRLGVEALNSSPLPPDPNGGPAPAAAQAAMDEIKEIRAIASETSKYLLTQFKELHIHIALAEKLLSSVYNMELGKLAGTPPMPQKVEDGFFDDLPMRFEKIAISLRTSFGLK